MKSLIFLFLSILSTQLHGLDFVDISVTNGNKSGSGVVIGNIAPIRVKVEYALEASKVTEKPRLRFSATIPGGDQEIIVSAKESSSSSTAGAIQTTYDVLIPLAGADQEKEKIRLIDYLISKETDETNKGALKDKLNALDIFSSLGIQQSRVGDFNILLRDESGKQLASLPITIADVGNGVDEFIAKQNILDKSR